MGPTAQGSMNGAGQGKVEQDLFTWGSRMAALCARCILHQAFTENAGLSPPPGPETRSCHPFPCPQERCWADFGSRVYLK